MARFILDVASISKEEIQKIHTIIERDEFLSDKMCMIMCIDEGSDCQFHDHDEVTNEDGSTTIFSPLMNCLSEAQIAKQKEIIRKDFF